MKEKIEKFSSEKYNKLIKSADDFFEAAERCSFNGSIKLGKYPLMIPQFTNRAFACELYLKATLYLTKNEIPRKHKLDELFSNLNEKDRKGIYNIWGAIAGQSIQDCYYAENMFCDNLEANSDIFTRFRYVHEWSGSSISLRNSFTEKQMHLNILSTSRPCESPPIYDGFLDQFAKSIKKYNNEVSNEKK